MRHPLRACRGWERGSMMVETAIVMPAYLILLFALLFFGYSTLAKQKMHEAGAFAAWLSGEQAAGDLMDRFFPWNPDAEEWAISGGTEARAGDAALAVEDLAEAGGGYDIDGVRKRLYVLSLGEVAQYFVWEDGQLVQRFRQSGDDASRYLTRNQITVENAPGADTAYTQWVTSVLNGGDGATPWLERRTANLRYTFAPHYLGAAIGGDEGGMNSREYLSMDMPNPSAAPQYATTFQAVGRGDLDRRGSTDVSRMQAVVGGGKSLAEPMSATALDSLKDVYWPGGSSLWEPR